MGSGTWCGPQRVDPKPGESICCKVSEVGVVFIDGRPARLHAGFSKHAGQLRQADFFLWNCQIVCRIDRYPDIDLQVEELLVETFL